MEQKHVVILGGGITGLASAYRLSQLSDETGRPIRCTLVEQAPRLGGKIHTKITDDYTLELGPDSIYTRKSGGVELIEELGLQDEIIPVSQSTGTFIWHAGRLQPLPTGFSIGVPSDLKSLVNTELLSLESKRRVLEDLFLPFEELSEDVSLGHFLRSRFGDELVDILASPLLAGIHAGEIDRMSLDATMLTLRKLYDEHHSLLLGAMEMSKRVMMSTKGQNDSAPAKPIFVNLRRGLEQLIETLAEKLRGHVNIQLDTSAIRMERLFNGKYRVLVRRAGFEEQLDADAVIVTTPAFVAADLLSGLSVNTTPLKSLRYASTATISFGFKTSPLPTDFTSSGFLIPRNEGTTITACTIVSNKWSHAAKTNHTLIRCYVGRDGSEESLQGSDDKLINQVAGDLRESLGVNAKPDFVEVKRWDKSMPQYDVGHLARLKEIDHQLASVPGIFLAGAAYRGMGIPDCIKDATRAAEQAATLLNAHQLIHLGTRK